MKAASKLTPVGTADSRVYWQDNPIKQSPGWLVTPCCCWRSSVSWRRAIVRIAGRSLIRLCRMWTG